MKAWRAAAFLVSTTTVALQVEGLPPPDDAAPAPEFMVEAGTARTPAPHRTLYHDANLQLDSVLGGNCEACGDTGQGSGSWDSQFRCSEQAGGVHQICYKNIRGAGFSEKTGQPGWSDERCVNCNHCVCLGAWALYVAKGGRRLEDEQELSDGAGGTAAAFRQPSLGESVRSSRSAVAWRSILARAEARSYLRAGNANLERQPLAPLPRLLLSKQMSHNMLKCNAIPETALENRYVGKWNRWNGHELPNQVVDGVEELVAQCLEQTNNEIERKHLLDLYCSMASNEVSLKERPAYSEMCDGSSAKASTAARVAAPSTASDVGAASSAPAPAVAAAAQAPAAAGTGAVASAPAAAISSTNSRGQAAQFAPAGTSGVASASSAQAQVDTAGQQTSSASTTTDLGLRLTPNPVTTTFRLSTRFAPGSFASLSEARAVLSMQNEGLKRDLCAGFVQPLGARAGDCVVERIVVQLGGRRALSNSSSLRQLQSANGGGSMLMQMDADFRVTAINGREAGLYEGRASSAVIEASLNSVLADDGIQIGGTGIQFQGRQAVASGGDYNSGAEGVGKGASLALWKGILSLAAGAYLLW